MKSFFVMIMTCAMAASVCASDKNVGMLTSPIRMEKNKAAEGVGDKLALPPFTYATPRSGMDFLPMPSPYPSPLMQFEINEFKKRELMNAKDSVSMNVAIHVYKMNDKAEKEAVDSAEFNMPIVWLGKMAMPARTLSQSVKERSYVKSVEWEDETCKTLIINGKMFAEKNEVASPVLRTELVSEGHTLSLNVMSNNAVAIGWGWSKLKDMKVVKVGAMSVELPEVVQFNWSGMVALNKNGNKNEQRLVGQFPEDGYGWEMVIKVNDPNGVMK